MNFVEQYLANVQRVAAAIPADAVESMVSRLQQVRQQGGRLFFLGVGGSAAHASHAACDFRLIAGFEAYAATDNVAELTARTNDAGWSRVFVDWLATSRLNPSDAILVLSVGGGDADKNVSPNLVAALDYAKHVGAAVLALVGRDGGHAARVADAAIVIPMVDPECVTAHTEGFQSVLLHLLAFHPALQRNPGRWESLR